MPKLEELEREDGLGRAESAFNVLAWAPQAAGVIHSDFECGFILPFVIHHSLVIRSFNISLS